MKTVIIYGVEHKGNTYNVVQEFKNELNIAENDVTEFFLPKDMPYFCVGCNNCFYKGEGFCPHSEYTAPIIEAFIDAKLIIIASPIYVFQVSGQIKAFMEHLAFRCMLHRPDKSMFTKTALVVSTVGVAGLRPAIKYMAGYLNQLGISRVFTFGTAVGGVKWEDTAAKIKKKVESISRKMLSKLDNAKPNLKIKGYFTFFRMIHRKGKFIPYEKEYWEKQGWLGNTRPWHS